MQAQSISATTIAGFPALTGSGDESRPSLLFVHGAFVDHRPFAPWMSILSRRGWRTLAAARRGRLGIGPARAEGLSIADYVDDTRKVIEALGETPIIVAHSLGGLIAQRLAELGLAQGLVLLAPAPPARLPAQAVAIPAYLPMLPGILTGRPVLPGFGGCSTIALNRMPEADRPACHAMLVPESGRAYREAIFGTFKVDTGKVRCPVTVLVGSEDRIVAPSVARRTAERYGAEFREYPGHAHWLLEEPGFEAIAGDVATWLDRQFPLDRSAPIARSA